VSCPCYELMQRALPCRTTGSDAEGRKQDAPVVPGKGRAARKRREEVVAPGERRQARDEERERDVHGDHRLAVDELAALGELEDLARDNADGRADDDAEHDLVQEDEDDPVPDRRADRVLAAQEDEEGEVLRARGGRRQLQSLAGAGRREE